MFLPLNRINKNHLRKRTMYFGSLCMGAEATAAFWAMKQILQQGYSIELVFSAMTVTFLRKAQTDVVFVSEHNEALAHALEQLVAGTDQRVSIQVPVTAFSQDTQECFAQFEFEVSLKKK